MHSNNQASEKLTKNKILVRKKNDKKKMVFFHQIGANKYQKVFAQKRFINISKSAMFSNFTTLLIRALAMRHQFTPKKTMPSIILQNVKFTGLSFKRGKKKE